MKILGRVWNSYVISFNRGNSHLTDWRDRRVVRMENVSKGFLKGLFNGPR